MKVVAATISAGVLALSMAVPSVLFAQETPPADPATGQAPAAAPPEEEQAADPGDPATEQPAAQPATVSEQESTATAVAVSKKAGSVSMLDFSFSPATVSIGVGESVTWTNNGQQDHTATGSGFDTGTVPPGGSATETFNSAGNFPYVCNFHPQMKGTVQVTGNQSSGPGTTDPGTTGTPDVLGSEGAAGTSPDAAGSASALPATGQSEPPLAAIGLGLLACGALAGLLARRREREDLA